jgi:hypothetical protein
MTNSRRFRPALAEARRQGMIPTEAPEAYMRWLVKVGEANIRVIHGNHFTMMTSDGAVQIIKELA